MSWLQSRPIKRLGYSSDAITIVGLLVGAVLALQTKGDDWGAPIAVIAGGGAGWLIGWGAALAIRRGLSRPCPACAGQGKVVGSPKEHDPAEDRCPRCGGAGRIV